MEYLCYSYNKKGKEKQTEKKREGKTLLPRGESLASILIA